MEFQAGVKTASGYLAVPESGSGPGVLVLHAWWGLNPFFVNLCDRLAREGFVVLAPDLYEGVIASTIEAAEQLRKEVDSEQEKGKVLEALDALRQHPAVQGDQVGTIGFSLGASWALQLSTLRPEEIAATVVFYGMDVVDFRTAHCAYLCHFGENDSWEPLEYAREMEAGMRASERKVDFYVYPGMGHWFFEEDRPDAYSRESAELAWNRTLSFLRDHR